MDRLTVTDRRGVPRTPETPDLPGRENLRKRSSTMNITDKTVVITGGGSGLGLACAGVVQRSGGVPVVLDLDVSQASRYRSLEVDVTDRDAVNEAVETVARQKGGIDALVAAAGMDYPGELNEVPADTWDHVIRVNLFGTVNAVRAALPHLKKTHGRIVTVSSTLALKGADGATAYCASKFAVRGFSQALAAETAGTVGVTNLIPGGMRTKFFDGRAERYLPGDGVQLNDPQHVAEAVVFALGQPDHVEVRELLIAHEEEGSWP